MIRFPRTVGSTADFPMEAASTTSKRRESIPVRIFNILSGFGLATTLLLLLGVLTWLATLEQVERGLLPTLKKYFDSSSFFFTPELKVMNVRGVQLKFPLPGGYWICLLLFVNLFLGGVIRARKGWRHWGNLISHSGILLLIVAGGVAQWKEVRGNMVLQQGQTSNVAQDYTEYVVEISEIKEGKPTNIHVIRGGYLDDLQPQAVGSWKWFARKSSGMDTSGATPRDFKLPDFPFDLQINGWLSNCQPVAAVERAPESQELIADGYYLARKEDEKQAEANTAGCYVRVMNRDGTAGAPFILAAASFHGYTVKSGDRVFLIDIHKRYWPMPYQVRLNKFTATFAPNTMKAESFVSEVTRIDEGHEVNATIQMNEPMRNKGLTFYQASYGPQGEQDPAKMYSVLEVVQNPSDQWPKISIAIVAIGLAIQFLLKLFVFIHASIKKA